MIDQGFMELKQCYRLDDCRELRDTAGAHVQGGQPEEKTIERGQIRSALPGSIADQQLMLEKKRLGAYGARAARTHQFRHGDEQVDGEDEDFAHERTLPRPSSRARLPHARGLRHTTNSPPTGAEMLSL